MNNTKLKTLIGIIFLFSVTIFSCSELTMNEDSSDSESKISTRNGTVLGIMQDGNAIVTVSEIEANNEINNIAVNNGNLYGELTSQNIIDEGAYGFSFIIKYNIAEMNGTIHHFTTSLPIILVDNDFIPEEVNGGRKKVTCKSKNCGDGCDLMAGSCSACAPVDSEGESSCEKTVSSGGGGGGGMWGGAIAAIVAWYLGTL